MAGPPGTPLPRKLGIEAGHRVAFPNAPPRGHGARRRAAAGLVDNKVCAIDATRSGPRLVIRLENR